MFARLILLVLSALAYSERFPQSCKTREHIIDCIEVAICPITVLEIEQIDLRYL
jgi:hypothetical protein